MFEVSQEASEKIRQFLEGRQGLQSIRILMTEGGWKGPYLVMALDEQDVTKFATVAKISISTTARGRRGHHTEFQ